MFKTWTKIFYLNVKNFLYLESRLQKLQKIENQRKIRILRMSLVQSLQNKLKLEIY